MVALLEHRRTKPDIHEIEMKNEYSCNVVTSTIQLTWFEKMMQHVIQKLGESEGQRTPPFQLPQEGERGYYSVGAMAIQVTNHGDDHTILHILSILIFVVANTPTKISWQASIIQVPVHHWRGTSIVQIRLEEKPSVLLFKETRFKSCHVRNPVYYCWFNHPCWNMTFPLLSPLMIQGETALASTWSTIHPISSQNFNFGTSYVGVWPPSLKA